LIYTIKFVFIVNNDKKALQGHRMETPEYIIENNIKIVPNIEYRKLFKSEQLIYMVNKPLTHILPELYEDNNDFLVGNKIIQNNNIRKNQLKKKSNKTNIINEVFGVK
jgi:hypothetical protein